jgi:hypothetical protein
MNNLDLTISGLGLMLNFEQLYNPDRLMVIDLIYLMDPMAETEPMLDGFLLTWYVHAFSQLHPNFG